MFVLVDIARGKKKNMKKWRQLFWKPERERLSTNAGKTLNFLMKTQEPYHKPERERKISQNSQENTCVRACNFIKKETLAQVFSCEFCETLKNTFFHRTPLVAASSCHQPILCHWFLSLPPENIREPEFVWCFEWV